MSTNGQYDVIIIGSGAGGGTLARHLAPTGKRVLILERGGWLPRELENWSADEVFVKNRYVPTETWYDKNNKTFQPGVHYWVGGATKLYGAALYRLRKEDFAALKHHDGVSPAWPIGYDDIEPYYTLAEQLYQVHGARGEDSTEPPASAPYPFPAVSHEPRIQQLHDDLAKAGYHPFHSPNGIMLNEAQPQFGTCIRCNSCDGFPCLLGAKSDAEVLGVRPALEHPNVTLLTEAKAIKLNTDPSGRTVTEVVVEHNGERTAYQADIIVVSAGAANSARLLLESANDRHPHGLANGSDQVGRNYMFHASVAVLAISKEPNPTRFQKTLGLNDFYFGMPGFDFPMGNIQMVGKSSGPMYKGEKPLQTKLAPMFTLDDIAKHAVDFWLSTEDLPRPDNRITVEPDGRTKLTYTPTNSVPKQKLYDKLRSMLNQLEMHEHLLERNMYMKNDIDIGGVAHQAGTSRFGTDPQTSVLDTNCKAHELDNLYVVDTSFFPSIGAVNPALTAMANALRVGDHIRERLAVPVGELVERLPVADQREIGAVYTAAIVQGVALVTFPAASTIFTSANYYGLSSTAYGGMFLPQAVTAIGASLIGAGLTRRWGIKRVFILGVLANLVSMVVLLLSQRAMTNQSLAYAMLLVATASLGIGFGLTVPSLNTFVASFYPATIERAVLILNALLGVGTVLAPVFVAIFLGLGDWSGLPLLVAVLLAGLLLFSSRLPLQVATATSAGASQQRGLPGRFWVFAAFAVLYGIVETMNGNWASLYMTSDLGANTTLAALALTAFWGSVTIGRVLFALIERSFPEQRTYHLLPFVAAVALGIIAILPSGSVGLGILAFALAGLGCSALLPLTIGFGQEELVAMAASVAGLLIAAYQVGYGVAAFGVGPLERVTGLDLRQIYGLTALVALVLAGLSFVVVAKSSAVREPSGSISR